jgi:predicted lipid-binding transport protein (Tim44 family)
MKRLLLAICGLAVGAAVVVTDADAARVGGGRSLGAQRSITSAPKAPAQQQAAPAQKQAAPAQPAPSGFSRWLPMLGGLALGGLLGSMFGGFGGGIGGILLIALLAIAAVMAFKAFARGREQGAPQTLRYAGMENEKVTLREPLPSSGGGETLDTRTAGPASVPAGFDTASFLRGAKMNFVKLQVANDAGRLDDIREFTTTEMFNELSKDARGRESGAQTTDVVTLEADLLEVATENDKYWASVRFSGMVRETPGTPPVEFEEVWNLVKPADGSSGWLLAGIQQMH